jgi:hypothetical protein
VCGGFAWVTDFLLYAPISKFGLIGSMILHPIWHFGAGTGTWLAIQVIAASRAEKVGAIPKVMWLFKCLPFIELEECKVL